MNCAQTKLLSYTFNEVVSTRRLGSRANNKHFVDLKLGNLMVQRVTRCETRQGMEITSIISAYIRQVRLLLVRFESDCVQLVDETRVKESPATAGYK